MSYTVTPAELGQFLDAVASAPVALRDVQRINSILARLIGLASGTGTVGVVPTEPSVSSSEAASLRYAAGMNG